MKPAEELFEAYDEYLLKLEDVEEKLERIFGFDPTCIIDPPPLTNFVHDDYDNSFEFDVSDPDWEPTEEQMKKAWELGFHRCWFKYPDGHEKYHFKREGDPVIKILKRNK